MTRGKENKIIGDMFGTLMGVAGVAGGVLRELGVSEKFGHFCDKQNTSESAIHDESINALRQALTEERKAREALTERVTSLEQKRTKK